ncbi:MAG: PepSY domain-containing protein [Gemmobacter sp.]|nr:PepSY domain-containing protein [Gemmobacter sp.]
MRPILILMILGAGPVAATAASADDHCDRPMRDWRPREAVEAKARELGVEVRRIRTDDGCYEIHGRMADGRSVEIEMDPVTLMVLETEYNDRTHHEDHHDDDDEDRGTAAPASGSAPPAPANLLIGPATGVTR